MSDVWKEPKLQFAVPCIVGIAQVTTNRGPLSALVGFFNTAQRPQGATEPLQFNVVTGWSDGFGTFTVRVDLVAPNGEVLPGQDTTFTLDSKERLHLHTQGITFVPRQFGRYTVKVLLRSETKLEFPIIVSEAPSVPEL